MEEGGFTKSTTGNTTISLNGVGTPTYIDFWVGPRTATVESTKSLSSFGDVDITNSLATTQSNYADSTHFRTSNSSGTSTGSSCLQHWDFVAGAATKIIDLKFVSAAAGAFTVNVVTANVNYTIFFRVFY